MYAPFGQGPAPHARWPSTKQEVAEVTVVGSVQSAEGPSSVNVVAYPTAGKLVEYVTSAVFSVRTVLAAADSLADILDRSRLGMAMAAMIRMIATTISSSMSENPFCLRIFLEISSESSVPRLLIEVSGRGTRSSSLHLAHQSSPSSDFLLELSATH